MSGCSACGCSSFHPHLFLPQKCLGCPHPKSAHNAGSAEADEPAAATEATQAAPPAAAPASAPAPAPAAAVSSPPPPQKPPPPLPSVLAGAPAATPATATLAAPTPPPKRGSMPPPIPPALQKQLSGGAEPASAPSPSSAVTGTAPSPSSAAPPPQPSQPRPPPRPSLNAPAGTVLLGSGSFPARSAPPPLPPASASAASSPSNANAAPQSQTQPAGSSTAPLNIPAGAPPPVPLHLRTDSGVNSSEVLFSPSPSTSASLAALLVGGGGAAGTPFSPASSIGSPESTTRVGSVNSRPPPLPAQSQQPPAASEPAAATNPLASPKGVSASAGFSNASQGQDQQWVDPNYRPSFAQKLHHKFDVVVDQSNTGMHLLKRVRAFMQRFSSLQERYAAELSKITSLERNKLIASAHADGMASCYTAWLGFFANMDELAVANQQFSEQLKEITVEQLERFYSIGTQMVKENKIEQERVSNHMLKVNVAVAKERDAASQALQKLAAKKLDTSSEGAGGSAGSGAGGAGSGANAAAGKQPAGQSGSFSLFKSSPSAKGFEKAKELTIKACESYSLSLAGANREHEKYHQQDLPNMMTQMQSLEEMRLHSLNTALANFSALQKQYTTKLTEISSDNQSLAQGMDANQDIHRQNTTHLFSKHCAANAARNTLAAEPQAALLQGCNQMQLHRAH